MWCGATADPDYDVGHTDPAKGDPVADLTIPRRTALVLIDLQRGFFEQEVLAAQADRIVAATNELVRRASARGLPIVNVITEHAPDKSTWTISMLQDDQGFNFTASKQVELLPGVNRSPGMHTMRKIRDSAFHGTDLAQRLRLMRVNRLLLCGVEAQNCLALTGRDAFAFDFEAAFAVDAIGSGRPQRGQQALEDNRDEIRQPLLAMDQVDNWW